MLNQKGYVTFKGRSWHALTVKRMLSNPAYAGRTYFGRTRRVTEDGKRVRFDILPESEWIPMPEVTPPIVTWEEFQEAQEALKGSRRRPVSPPASYLLRSHILCGLCSGPLTGTILSRRYRYYQCTHARKQAGRPTTCTAKYVRAEPLEESVWSEVVRILENPEVVISEVKNRRQQDLPFGDQEVHRINKELASLDNEERRLLRVTRKGEFTAKYVLDEMKDIQRMRTDLNRQKAEMEASRRLIDSLNEVDEHRIQQICATVRENVGRLEHDGKLQALDALGARVVATSESAVLYGYLPSYVTIEQTSA